MIATLFLVLASGFLLYGTRLHRFLTAFITSSSASASEPLATTESGGGESRLQMGSTNAVSTSDTEKSIQRVLWVTRLCTVCFAVRFVAFLWGSLTFNNELIKPPLLLDQLTYPVLFYTVPDLLPGPSPLPLFHPVLPCCALI